MNNKINFLIIISVLIFSSCRKKGCTDPLSLAYDIEASKEYFDLLDETQKVAPHKQNFLLYKTSLDFDSSLSAMVEGKWKLIDYESGFCKLK